MFDALIDLLRFLFYLLAFLFFMMALPFIICHVAENWDAPEYPYSGFTPDCPPGKSRKTPCRLQMCNPPAAQMTCHSDP